MKILFSIVTLIIGTHSCNSSKELVEKNNLQTMNKGQIELSGRYAISEIDSKALDSDKLYISFDNKTNKVSGFAGCNTFFGAYAINNSELKISDIAASKKYCKPEINNQESQFLKVLGSITTFTIKDNVLILLDGNTALLKASKKAETQKKDMVKGNNGIGVSYQISSRGLFEYVNITETNISFTTDRDFRTIKTYSSKDIDWPELNSMITAIDLDTFKSLEAPSDARFTDAAAEATLTIKMGDVLHTSPAFDHGNPPKEIEALVNKVLSIKENTVKQ